MPSDRLSALRIGLSVLVLAIALAFPAFAGAQANDLSRNMNQPVPPFHIIGNIKWRVPRRNLCPESPIRT